MTSLALKTLGLVIGGGSAGGLVAVLIHIIILALIFGLIFWALSLIPIPEPFGQIVRVLCIVFAVILIIVALLSLL